MTNINSIKSRLSEYFIKAENSWLEGCIACVTAEQPRMSIDELFSITFNQWLLGDLKEVGIPCLPNQIFQSSSGFDLNGNFLLQLNYLLDISESAYDQLRTIQDKILDATDEEQNNENRPKTKRKRLLKLVLTDGNREVVAMEYSPILCLNTKLLPGCKILLKGPIKCLNKVLFLKPENVKIIGGEVDSLLVCNAYENVLLKQLKKPLKTDPNRNYKEFEVVEESQRPEIRQTKSKPAIFIKPDEIAAMLDDPFPEMDDEDMLICQSVEEAERNQRNKPKTQEIIQSDPIPSSSTKKDILPEFQDFVDASLFMDDDPFDLEAIRGDIDREFSILSSDYEFKFYGIPLATIDQIQGIKIEDLIAKPVLLQAKFDSFFEKLKFTGDECTMSIFISDSFSKEKLKVKISNPVLEKICGYSSSELKEMFKQVQRMPQIKEELQKALDQMRETITKLDSAIKVEYINASQVHSFTLVEIMSSKLEKIFREKAFKENL